MGHYKGSWGSLGRYPGVTLRVFWGHFEGTLKSLWEYSEITWKGTSGATLGKHWGPSEGLGGSF